MLAGVLRVVPGHGLQHQGRILDGARHGPHVIEGPGQGDHAPGAHAAVGGLQSDDAAIGGRLPYGSPGIGAQCAVAEVRRHGDGRSRGRPARRVGGHPGIGNRAEIADHRAAPIGALVHVQLAQDHRPPVPQSADDLGVPGGDAILEDAAGRGGAHTRRIHQVLEGDRDSVQWPPRRAVPQAGLRLTRLGQGLLGRDRDEGVELRVQRFDAAQAGLGQLDGRYLPVAEQLRSLGEAEPGQLRTVHAPGLSADEGAHPAGCGCPDERTARHGSRHSSYSRCVRAWRLIVSSFSPDPRLPGSGPR